MLSLTCPACAKHLKAKPEFAGKKVKCPGCGAPVDVPKIVEVRPGPPPARPVDRTVPPKQPDAPTLLPDQDRGSAASHASAPGPSQADRTSAEPPADSNLAESYEFLAPPQQPDEIGRLGPYRVLKALGAGGMGAVFVAEDPVLGRRVALKVMLPKLASSASAKQRFLREARAAAAIEHDHIVPIYQVGEDRGVPYMAMQLLKGESLDDRLQRGPSGSSGGSAALPIAEVIRIGQEIARGLAAAHKRDLVHRDIKPANIWLEDMDDHIAAGLPADEGGGPSAAPASRGLNVRGPYRVKILDFGLARALSDQTQLTQQGMIVGTPAYMAPEQATGGTIDHRCDLFSLGCVLYRLCTGEMPFKGNDTLAILSALAMDDPVPPLELRPDLPRALADLVMRLLAKKPDDRPASAQAVAQALAEVTAEETEVLPQELGTGTRRVIAKARAGGNGRRVLWAGVAAVVLAGAGLGVWLMFFRTRENQGGPPVVAKPLTDKAKPFLLLRQNGPAEEFQNLLPALIALADGDVIEVHGNGPFEVEKIELTGKGLRLKAAPGYRPEFRLQAPISVKKAGLHLEGCDFGFMGNFLHGDGAPWRIRSCRIQGVSGNSIVFSYSGPEFSVADCVISTHGVNGGFTLGPESKLELVNCIFDEVGALLQVGTTGGQHIRLRQNLVRSGNALLTLGKPLARPVTVEASDNIFIPPVVLGDSQEIRKSLTWLGRNNLHAIRHGHFNQMVLGILKDKNVHLDEKAWAQFWGKPDEGSWTADELVWHWSEFPTLAPDAIRKRVQPHLDGLRRQHPDLKAGPDWELIGPGPAYLKALAAAGKPIPAEELRPQAPAGGPIVLLRGGKMVRGFVTLQEAVKDLQDGDSIEIRSDGVFAGCAIPKPAKGLLCVTVRAGLGYRPTITNTGIAFQTGVVLGVEGLHFREGRIWAGKGVADAQLGQLARLANCSFESAAAPSPNAVIVRSRSHPEVKDGVEIVNCLLPRPASVDLAPDRELVVRNSLLGSLVFNNPCRAELRHSLFWNAYGSPALSVGPTAKGTTIKAGKCLFQATALVGGHTGVNCAWHGDGNAYWLLNREWAIHNSFIMTLDAWKKATNSPETGSVVLPSILEDPREWRVVTPADLKGAGPDVSKIGGAERGDP